MGMSSTAQHLLEQALALDPRDRAVHNHPGAEQAYREAIRLDRTNPWWNGRLVTFLIGQGRLRAARTAWQEPGKRRQSPESSSGVPGL